MHGCDSSSTVAADDDADVDKVSCESFCGLADGPRCWAAHLSAPPGVSSPQKRERLGAASSQRRADAAD
jgi:hypothetical protein